MVGCAGPVSNHFDGKHFFNPGGCRPHGFLDLLRWQLNSRQGFWPEWTDVAPQPAPPTRVPRGRFRITVVNHATILAQGDGVNLLLDPIWSERASPFSWIGPKRRRPPGILLEDLPPLSAVLLTHNHYDHLDTPTLKSLARGHRPVFIAPLGVGDLLRRNRIGVATELDWWESSETAGVRVTATPAVHFSARRPWDRNRTLWCGYAIQFSAGTLYCAGDTAYGPHFKIIGERFAPVRAACLPIGAYLPRWFMGAVHMDPAEAVQAHADLLADMSIAVHFGTFALGDDGEREAVADLDRALRERCDSSPNVVVPEFGCGIEFA
jgi:L-ascorbate metabolism protein UlaG (beta-lactamase superfamily)